MKRKIIQLAGKTLVVSLPSKWVQKYGAQKGQEIEITENGRELILKTEGEPEIKKVEFDTRGKSERVIAWILSGLHKKGYDEIEIIYDDAVVMKRLQQAVKDYFVGFVIVNQTSSRCVIKSISKDSEDEFDTALRRSFLVTISMGENLVLALREGELQSLENLINLEKTNNQLTNFCERILIKKGHPSPEKTCFYYVIAWNLEKVCDDYKYICDYLLKENKPGQKQKILPGKEVISLLSQVNEFLREYYNQFYGRNPEKLTSASLKGFELIGELRANLKSKNEADRIISSLLINQVTKIIDFATSTVSVIDSW